MACNLSYFPFVDIKTNYQNTKCIFNSKQDFCPEFLPRLSDYAFLQICTQLLFSWIRYGSFPHQDKAMQGKKCWDYWNSQTYIFNRIEGSLWKVLNEKGFGFRDKEIQSFMEIGNKQFITSNKQLILFGLIWTFSYNRKGGLARRFLMSSQL